MSKPKDEYCPICNFKNDVNHVCVTYNGKPDDMTFEQSEQIMKELEKEKT